MTVNFTARQFGDEYQAQPLAGWIGGFAYTGDQHGHTNPPWVQHTCITPPDGAAGKPVAEIGDWIIRGEDGSVRIEAAGSQEGYCTDCGKPVWWQDDRLVTRIGLRWCQGLDDSHAGMTHWHALPGMAQYVVRSPEGRVCHCLDRAFPHMHEIIVTPPERAHRLWQARAADGCDILADLRYGPDAPEELRGAIRAGCQGEADRRLWELLEQAET